MRKQFLAMALAVAIAAVIQLGCGGKISSPGGSVGTPPGSVAIFAGDAPLCSILSFTVTITGITLTPQSGGSPVSVLAGGNPVTLDFASLLDFLTMLSLSNVPPGTYSKMTITLSNPRLTFLDSTKTPPGPTTITPTLTVLNLTLDLATPLTVSSNETVAVKLDFSLLNSVLTDATTGEITGHVNPIFTVVPVSVSGNSFADFEDLRGIVQGVHTSSSNSAFVGDFTLQTPLGPTLTINASSSTTFAGIATGLTTLTTGTFVEVGAFLDANGNIVANTVEAEEQEDAPNGRAAVAGLISSVTRDTAGKATQFELFVRQEAPDVSSRVPLRSLLTVNVGTSTTFSITSPASNLASFSFDPTTLGAGQKVVVHAQLPSGGGAASTVDARSIFLGVQPILGHVDLSPATPVVKNSGSPTAGGFTLLPCSPLFQPRAITVVTFPQTVFAGITDLNGLTSSTPFLVVKGLWFYQQTAGTLNSVVWAPPANVQEATQVHQLP